MRNFIKTSALAAVLVVAGQGVADAATTAPVLVSVGPDGNAVADRPTAPKLSDGGRWVAFETDHTDADGYRSASIYLRDRSTGVTKRIWSNSDVFELHWDLSGGGTTVLVSYETLQTATEKTTIYHRSTGTWKKLNDQAEDGVSLSDDGRKAALFDYSNLSVVDLTTGTATKIAGGDQVGVWAAKISGDGSKVAYQQSVFEGQVETAGFYERDLATGTDKRVDVKADGSPANQNSDKAELYGISDNGRYVAFSSWGSGINADCPQDAGTSDPLCLFRRDMTSNDVEEVGYTPDGKTADLGYRGELSGNGNVVAFIATQPGTSTLQAYARDISARQTRMVSTNADGQPAVGGVYNPRNSDSRLALSDGGTRVVYGSGADNLGESGTQARLWLSAG